MVPNDHLLVLFDGVCNLCNSSVNFVIDRDKSKKFKFASLQSETAIEILKEMSDPVRSLDSIVLIKNQRIYRRSRAVLEIVRELGGLWPILYIFKIIPPVLGDLIYNWIAKNRYKWFGKTEKCRVPTEDYRERFLEEI